MFADGILAGNKIKRAEMEIPARLNPISYEKPLSKRTIESDIVWELYFIVICCPFYI
jgi:hypothetical protein